MIDDIRALLNANPVVFRSFVMTTTTNLDFEVTSPKQVTIPAHGETIHYHSRDWETHVTSVRHIVKVSVREGKR